MPEPIRGVGWIIAEHAPKLAIATAMFYLLVRYINVVIEFMKLGSLDPYIPAVTYLMLFGAFLCLPLAIYDIIITGFTKRDVDIIMMGFVNYWALLTEYAFAQWATVKPILTYVAYVYLGLFIAGLIWTVISYMVWRYKPA